MDNTKLVGKLVSGTGFGLIGSIGGRLINVISSIFIARVLGPTYFGLYSIGWTLIRFMSLLATLGMDRVILKFAPRFLENDKPALRGLLFRAIGVSISSGLLGGIFLFFVSPWLAIVVYQKPELVSVFKLFSIAFPPIIALSVVAASSRITQKMQYSVFIQDIGQSLIGLVLMIFFYLIGLSLIGIILADVISNIIALIAGAGILLYLFPEIFKIKSIIRITYKEMFGFSFPAVLAGAFSVYIFWIDRVLVGYFRTTFENGIYQSVSQISTIFLVISAGINMIVVPMFANYYQNNDKKGLEEIYRISTKWGIYLSIPIIGILIISPKEVISFIYGSQYIIGSNLLLVLIIGQVINLFTGSVNPLLIMTGNQSFLFRLSGIVLFFDLLLNLILIPSFGLIGAAISTSVSLSILYIVALFWVKRKLFLWPFDRRYFKGVLAGSASLLGIYIVKLFFPLMNGMNLLLQGFTGIIVFSFSIFIQKLDYEDYELINKLKRFIFKRKTI